MDGTFDPAGEQATWCKVGAELRRLRTDRGVALSKLGCQAHYTKGYLSKIENGKKRLTPELARRLDEALQTGGVLFGLVSSPVTSTECLTPVGENPDPADTEVCPYPGLVAFGLPESRWFFGRDQATSEVISRLGDRLTGSGPLVVVAPSGAGKSSLLAAGVIPALAGGALSGSCGWLVVVTTPGAHPLASLAAQAAKRIGADPAAATVAGVDPERFVAFLTGTVAAQGGKTGEAASPARVVLIVDQFEETFTECQQEAERQAFITALCTAARSAVVVVLGVRADFYGHCLAYPALLSAVQAPVALGPMSSDQLRSIITGPAVAEGLQVEPGLVELLLRDLGVTEDPGAQTTSYDPGALPLLAHTLRATWQQRHGQLLTVAGYQRTGGIRGAIATTAEHVYTRLNPPEQRIAQQLLLRLVRVDAHAGALRRRVLRERLLQALPAPTEAIEKILETFVRARLLTFDTDSVEITHEALLRAWPRLADWISTDRAGLRIHHLLSEAAEAWDNDDRDPFLLYRGSRLAIARDWATGPGHTDQLSTLEQVYLQTSIDQKHREQHEQQRHTRRLRTLVGVLATSLVVALLAGGIAFQQYHKANEQSRLLSAIQLATTSQSVAAMYPETAMLAAVNAYQLVKVPMTLSALLNAQSQYFAGQLTGHTRSINTTMFNRDGSLLATAGDDGTARLWDVARHQLIATLSNHTGPIHDAEFNPDGSLLATAGDDGTARLWDVARHQLRATLPATLPGVPVSGVTFSHDGRILATAGADGVRLWDVTTHRSIATLPGQVGPGLIITKVIFSPKNPILAVGSYDNTNTVQLWNVANPARPRPLGPPLTGHAGPINKVVFSPDGHVLATGSDDKTSRLWNVTDPAHPRPLGPPLTGHTDSVSAVAFSPDGLLLVTGSGDGTTRLWDTSTYKTAGTLKGHNSSIMAVAFSPDRHTVATAGSDHIARLWDTRSHVLIPSPLAIGHDVEFSPDGRILAIPSIGKTVQLWDVTDPANPTPLDPLLAGRTNSVTSVAFSRVGHILATAGADGARLWNVASHQLIATLDSHTTPFINTMVFSPDGIILATGSYDNTVRLWNVTDPAHPTSLGQPLTSHTSAVDAVAFSSDGHTLATGSVDNTVRLWNVTDPAHPTPLGQPLTSAVDGVVSFSSDDRILVNVSDDGIVKRWERATGHPIPTRPITTLPGEHFSQVAISHNGNTLATTSDDGTTTKLWNIDRDTDHPITTLTDHTGHINAATFSRDGHLLATVSNDGTVRLWDLNPDRVITRLCHIIGTPNQDEQEEWAQLIPDVPYQPTCH